FYRFADVRLRGLVAALQDDPRMRAFAESELAGLLDDQADGGRSRWSAVDFLKLLLRKGGNKSAIAQAMGLSRPAVYARAERLERRLGVSLDDAESRAALHTAVLWWRARK